MPTSIAVQVYWTAAASGNAAAIWPLPMSTRKLFKGNKIAKDYPNDNISLEISHLQKGIAVAHQGPVAIRPVVGLTAIGEYGESCMHIKTL